MPKVLVADDSIAVRKVAERLLTEAGMGVVLAANGEEALALLAKEVPDLIVSDVIMPDKSGYEVCTFVRAQSTLANTPVLLISGIVNDEVAKQAESCHADGVLKKPFQGTSLKDRVLELLAKKQRQPEASEKSAVAAPVPASDGSQVAKNSDDQSEAYRQAVIQLKYAEEELQKERQHSAQLSERLAQLEEQSGRVKELEAAVASEREQAAQAKKAGADLALANQRVMEFEALLKKEQDEVAQLKQQCTDLRAQAGRIKELEVALQKERAQSTQTEQKINELQRAATRVQELDAALNAERQAATQLVQQMTTMEKAVSRSQELSKQLNREQGRVEELTRRLAEAEAGGSKTNESQALLEAERERNAVLTRRVSEAELAAQQAMKGSRRWPRSSVKSPAWPPN